MTQIEFERMMEAQAPKSDSARIALALMYMAAAVEQVATQLKNIDYTLDKIGGEHQGRLEDIANALVRDRQEVSNGDD